MKKIKLPKRLVLTFSIIGELSRALTEVLGYCTLAYIVCFLLFGGEIKIEIHFKEGFEALKCIVRTLTNYN